MIPSADKEVLREFEPLSFPCRPEAPWIKRCKYGIKFTEEIQDDDKVQLVTTQGTILADSTRDRGGTVHIHAEGPVQPVQAAQVQGQT